MIESQSLLKNFSSFDHLRLATTIAAHNEWPNRLQIIRRFLFLDRNDWEVINLLFVLPELYLNILKTSFQRKNQFPWRILTFIDRAFVENLMVQNCARWREYGKGIRRMFTSYLSNVLIKTFSSWTNWTRILFPIRKTI